MTLPTCPNGGKRCFKSRRAAKQATKRVHNKFRCYRYPFCHEIHVTSDRVPEMPR